MTKKGKIDNLAITKAWKETEKFYSDITSKPTPAIYINDGQPGTGKTESLAKIIAKTDKKYAFFTTNHHHLEKFAQDLEKYGVKKSEYIHGEGFQRSCKRYPPETKDKKDWTKDEKSIYIIYHRFKEISTKTLCSKCRKTSSCRYYEYTNNSKKYRITLQPLEFLFTSYNSDKDIFILDEAVDKKERRLWNFSWPRLDNFIEKIEEISGKRYIFRDYFNSILDFHRTLLQHSSLIFNEKPEILEDFLRMDDKEFNKKNKEKMFIKYETFITHPQTINLDCLDWDVGRQIRDLLVDGEESDIIRYTNEQIKKAIRGKDKIILKELIEDNVSVLMWFKFFEIIFNKDPGGKISFVVRERLERTRESEITYRDKKIVSIEGNYEKGFFDESPYLKNKTSGEIIISRIGKEFQGVKDNPDTLNDAWITIGHPYLHKAFSIAQEKPVLLLDATFNRAIFEKLLHDWFMYYSMREFWKYPESKLEHVLKKYRKNVNVISRTHIENKHSIVYDVEKNFPLTSLRSGTIIRDVIGFIATILDDNPGKSYAIISHKEFEDKFKTLFSKAVTAHHLDQRGKTIVSNLLFVVGTPYPPPLTSAYEYILMFNELPTTIEKKDTKTFTGYKDPLLQEILQIQTHDENYHELHRTRMLLYNKEVYALCVLPDKIRDEVTVKEIPNMLAVSCSALWNLMNIIIKNDGEDKKKIYDKVRNRVRFKVAGGWKGLIEELEDREYIVFKKEKSKTKPITTIHSTSKGRRFHRIQERFYKGR